MVLIPARCIPWKMRAIVVRTIKYARLLKRAYFFCCQEGNGLIQLRNVAKWFDTKNGRVQAVDDVSLTIESGEIFGIIGYSGAGRHRASPSASLDKSGCVFD